MPHDLITRTLVDTPERAVQHCLGRATNNTSPELSANVVFDSSASAYALATVTLAAAPTTNFCIGEIITADSISMVVQDYERAASTVKVYRCTSGTDNTPLGWAGATVPGTSEAIVGSVSGTCSTTTHASTVVAHVQKEIVVKSIRWAMSTGHTMMLYFTGSAAVSHIGFFSAQGSWGPHMGLEPIWSLPDLGNDGDLVGDILCRTFKTGVDESESFQIELTKGAGYGQPNFEGNGQLGYSPQLPTR